MSANLTVYTVLALSLFRRLSVVNVLSTLLSCLRDVIPDLPFRPASDVSICEARYRLGYRPLKTLFEARAATISPPPSFHGLRVWAIDGVRFKVPDTDENKDCFGKPVSARGTTAYPVALVVALVDTYGHRVKGIAIDRWDGDERDAVQELIEPLDERDVVLTYQCGKKTCRILTDLMDPVAYSAQDLAELYHERWEIELVYDEVKNHFATPHRGSQNTCIRSKLPEGVLQELYALFAAFNFVRDIIVTAAETHQLQPRQISFVDALTAILQVLPRLVVSTPLQQSAILRRLYRDIARHCRLRKRRKRQYARKVKVKMSDFKCKTPTDRQGKEDLQPQLVKPTFREDLEPKAPIKTERADSGSSTGLKPLSEGH